MHYYQFNIGDYAKSTKYLTDLQDLAYRRLLDVCYDSEKPLPKSVEEVAEIIGFLKNPSEVSQVLKKYFKLTKNGFIQKRVQKELGVYQARAMTARSNGKMGGRPKNNPEITQSVDLANPEITQLKANQEPRTNNQQPVKRERDAHAKTSIDSNFKPDDETLTRLKINGHKKLNQDELEIFIDHYKSEGGLKVDWNATYKKWVVSQRTIYDKQSNNQERGYSLDQLGEDFINGN